jgi:threonine/homoserine/homoserine lactone efflux protein
MENTIIFSESELEDLKTQFRRGRVFSVVNKIAGIVYFLVVLVHYLETDLSLPESMWISLVTYFSIMLLMVFFSVLISKAMRHLRAFVEDGDWMHFEKYAQWLLASYILFTLEAMALLVSFVFVVYSKIL